MKHLLMAACMSAALMLSGCGGGDSAEPVSAPGVPVDSTSQAMSGAGGTVKLQGLALTLGPSALSQPVQVGLQQETIGSEAIARFRLSPAGQALSVPADLQFSAAGLPSKAMFFWEVDDELWMIPGAVTGGVLRATVSSLGYAAPNSGLGRAQAQSLGTRARAQGVAPSEGAGLVVQVPVCRSHVQALANRLKGVTDPDRAVGIYNDLVATQIACEGLEIQLLQQRSCEALETAQLNARTVLAESFTSFQAMTMRLFSAQAYVQMLGAECTQVNPELTTSLIEAKFDQFLQVLQGQLLRGDFAQEATVRELQVLMAYEATCQLLGLHDMCDRLTDVIYPDLLDGMRQAGFDECRHNGSPLALSQFYALGSLRGNEQKFFEFGRFSLGDVEADLSYCTDPRLNIRVFDDALNSPEELTDRATTLAPLNGLGSYASSKVVAVPRAGSLTVAGQVAALRCPDGTASQADLVVRLGTHEVARRSVGSADTYPLDTFPLDLVVSRMFATTSLDPDLTTDFTLDFYREGGSCNDGGNPVMNQPFKLFEIKVNLPGANAGVLRGRLVFTQIITFLGHTTGSGRTEFSANVELTSMSGLRLTSLQSSGDVGMRTESSRTFGSGGPECNFTERTLLVQQSDGTSNLPGPSDMAMFRIDEAAATWTLSQVNFTMPMVGQTMTTRTYTGISGDCSRMILSDFDETKPIAFNSQRIMSFFSSNDPSSATPLSGVVTLGSDGRRSINFSSRTVRTSSDQVRTVDVLLELSEDL